jgi:hypothetical protein
MILRPGNRRSLVHEDPAGEAAELRTQLDAQLNHL